MNDLFNEIIDTVKGYLADPELQNYLIIGLVIFIIVRIVLSIRWMKYLILVTLCAYLFLAFQNGSLNNIIKKPFFTL